MNLKSVIDIFEGFELINNVDVSKCDVENVTVLDAPDSIYWVGKGEFVVSSGYIYRKNPNELVNVIEKLKENKASAFGLKLDRYIYNLPKTVIDRANELNFPIIYVPERYSYAEVIDPILYRVANDSYTMLKEIEKIRNELTNMLVIGTDIEHILEYLYTVVKCQIYFKDNISKKVISYPFTQNTVGGIYKKEILLKEELVGTLYFENDFLSFDDVELASIDYAATLINLFIQRELFESKLSENYKSELSMDLCNNNLLAKEEIYYRSNINNWKIEYGIQVIIYDIDDYKKATISNKYSDAVLKKQKEIFYSTILNNNKFYPRNRGYFKKSDSIVLMYSVDMNNQDIKKEFDDLINKNKKALEENTCFEITVGVGKYFEDILDTHKSYITAMKAVKYGRIFKGNNQVHRYNEISLFRNLYESYTNGIDEFSKNNILEKIRAYDRNNEGELEKTLIALMNNGWNIAATSRNLYIHYNTVNYRYEKILEILNKESLDSNDKFLLQLYAKFDEIKNSANWKKV